MSEEVGSEPHVPRHFYITSMDADAGMRGLVCKLRLCKYAY